jgi:lipopolysaccharide export system protein LptA
MNSPISGRAVAALLMCFVGAGAQANGKAPVPAPSASKSAATTAGAVGSDPAPVSPSPENPSARTHLHRPGTDVDSDVLTGSLASEVYVLKGNVTLHSDPKIDRAIAEESQSDEPLTITADEIDVDRLGLSYVAKGNVRFVQGTRSGRADLAMLNEQAHTLDLIGNASVLDGERRAVAAKMHYNTLDKQFRGSGDVRIYQPLPPPNPKPQASPTGKHKRRFPL